MQDSNLLSFWNQIILKMDGQTLTFGNVDRPHVYIRAKGKWSKGKKLSHNQAIVNLSTRSKHIFHDKCVNVMLQTWLQFPLWTNIRVTFFHYKK